MNFLKVLKTPYAFLPILMSFAALAVVVMHVMVFGTAREPDEGAGAHVFQALMVAQVPFILLFAARFVPKEPKNSLVVIAFQIGMAMVALAPVWWLKL